MSDYSEEDREAFEKMALKLHIAGISFERDEDGCYLDKHTQSHWVVFGIAWGEASDRIGIVKADIEREREHLKAANEKLLARDAEHIRQFNELSEFRHRNIEVFDKKIALLETENEALRKDAERYRWLRAQHWDSSAICCVVDPKMCTKLGSYCPSLDLLDQAVDAGIKLGKEKASE